MFTGIIKNLGEITTKTETDLIIKVDTQFLARLEIGASVAVDGICLTVTKFDESSFTVEFMPETLKRTNLQYLNVGNSVNLEMPTTPDSFLAGHIVQGHVDGIAKLIGINEEGNSRILKFSVPETLAKYIVEKGSIAINGVSLTVIKSAQEYFTVGIIPHTWNETMFHEFKIGDYANIEVDVLAKYVEKLIKRN